MTDTTTTDSTTEHARQRAADVASEASNQTSQLADEATGHARALVDDGRRSLRAETEQRAEQVAVSARGLASDLRSMGRSTDSRLAGLADEGAQRIEALVDRFDRDGVDGVNQEVRRYARRRPLVYLASTFAAGVAAGRVLRNTDNDHLRSQIVDSGEDRPKIDVADVPSSAAPGVSR